MDLKPCPFCGKKVEIIFKLGIWGYTSNTVSIKCCFISLSADAEAWEKGIGQINIKEKAIKKISEEWNRRTEPTDWRKWPEEKPKESKRKLYTVYIGWYGNKYLATRIYESGKWDLDGGEILLYWQERPEPSAPPEESE